MFWFSDEYDIHISLFLRMWSSLVHTFCNYSQIQLDEDKVETNLTLSWNKYYVRVCKYLIPAMTSHVILSVLRPVSVLCLMAIRFRDIRMSRLSRHIFMSLNIYLACFVNERKVGTVLVIVTARSYFCLNADEP